MQLLLAILLFLVAVSMFVAAWRNWIHSETLQIMAKLGGVVAMLAAILALVLSTSGPNPIPKNIDLAPTWTPTPAPQPRLNELVGQWVFADSNPPLDNPGGSDSPSVRPTTFTFWEDGLMELCADLVIQDSVMMTQCSNSEYEIVDDIIRIESTDPDSGRVQTTDSRFAIDGNTLTLTYLLDGTTIWLHRSQPVIADGQETAEQPEFIVTYEWMSSVVQPVNLRAGPGTESEILDGLDPGTPILIRALFNDWYLVALRPANPAKSGFVGCAWIYAPLVEDKDNRKQNTLRVTEENIGATIEDCRSRPDF